jgi:hypothetical protein
MNSGSEAPAPSVPPPAGEPSRQGAHADAVIPRFPPTGVKALTKKSILWRTAGFIGLALFGAVLGYLGARFGTTLLLPVPGKLYKLVVVVALPAVWLLVVGWHELGHLVGGWLTGGRFLLWVTGPFMIRRTPVGIRLAWNRSVNLGGGMAACLPLEPGRMTPHRAAVMIVGGPVASLVLTVIALWLSAALTAAAGPVPSPWAVAQHVALATAGMSLMIFLVTAFPGSTGGFKTDGKRVLDLLRGDGRSAQEAAMLALTTAGLGGVRPADYDPALVARVVSLRDGSLFDLYGNLTAFTHAADRGEWAMAQNYLDRVLAGEDQVAPVVRDLLRCDYAWLLATQADAPVMARAWLETAGKLDFDPATRLRAEAAVLLAEGRPAEAAGKARAGLHALRHRSMSPVESLFVRESLEAIIRRADSPVRPQM